MGTTVLFALLVQAVPLAVGLLLLLRGWRGERIDDHPGCRRCGFDLFGAPAGSTRCPECGSDLSSPGTVREGNRRRQPALIGAGVAGVAFALVAGGAMAWTAASGYDVNRLKPVWLLARDARGADAAVATASLNELGRRLAAGALSDAQVAGLVDHALAHQRDAAATWRPGWGALVEQAHVAGALPREKWESYLKMAAESTYALEVRPKIRRGDRIMMRLSGRTPRVAGSIRLRADYDAIDLSIAGVRIAQGRISNNDVALDANSSGGAMTFGQSLTSEQWAKLADGPQELRYRLAFTIRAPAGEAVRTDVELRAPWTLVAASAETVRVIRDESLRPVMEKRLSIQQLSRSRNGDLGITVAARDLPAPVAYDVVFRADGREWPLGSVHFQAGKASAWGIGGATKGLTAEAGDVVLRPSVQAARESIDLTEMWDGEVVIRDVKVQVRDHP